MKMKSSVGASKVYQTDFDPGQGNALQAAVASIFTLPLDVVPNFIELACGYEDGIQSFCKDRNVECTKISLNEASKDLLLREEGKLCILRGKSPRGNFGHVIIARILNCGFEMVHDVHPDQDFLDRQEPYGWCMVFH